MKKFIACLSVIISSAAFSCETISEHDWSDIEIENIDLSDDEKWSVVKEITPQQSDDEGDGVLDDQEQRSLDDDLEIVDDTLIIKINAAREQILEFATEDRIDKLSKRDAHAVMVSLLFLTGEKALNCKSSWRRRDRIKELILQLQIRKVSEMGKNDLLSVYSKMEDLLQKLAPPIETNVVSAGL